MRPRFEAQRKTKVITSKEFNDGFVVTCDAATGIRYMTVSYQKLAVYSNGNVLVIEPVWRTHL